MSILSYLFHRNLQKVLFLYKLSLKVTNIEILQKPSTLKVIFSKNLQKGSIWRLNAQKNLQKPSTWRLNAQKTFKNLQPEGSDLRPGLFANINKDDGLKSLLPNMLILLKLGILCPVGNSVVERLFSLMKLVKTPLRNLLSKSLDIFYYKICIFFEKMILKNLAFPFLWTIFDIFKTLDFCRWHSSGSVAENQ